MRILTACLTLAGICSLFAGCIPESEQPLSDISEAQQDAALHGVWTLTDERGNVQYLHIGAEAEMPLGSTAAEPEAGLMRFWLVTLEANTGRVAKPFGMRFFATQIGDDSYANAVMPFENQPQTADTTYWFIKYEVDGDDLKLWGINQDAVAGAIDVGQLQGTVEREDGRVQKVLLTDSSERIAAYLRDGGDAALFPDRPGVYHRVR